jgi:non-heme chloroperoxidase
MKSLYKAADDLGIPFENEPKAEDRYLPTQEVRLHYLDWGTVGKQAVVFLHGFAQTSHTWDLHCLGLRDDYHAVALDARGHGDSDWAADKDYSYEAHQRDLDRFLNQVPLSMPIFLVGLSMGARNAYVLASRRAASIKGLVLIDHGPTGARSGRRRIHDFVTLKDELESFEAFVQRVLGYLPNRSVEQIRYSLLHSLKQLPSGKWTWKYDPILRSPSRPNTTIAEKDAWEILSTISCPTLLIRGQQSDILSRETADRMLQTIPECEYAEVERAGHLVPGDNPIEFFKTLKCWLSLQSG